MDQSARVVLAYSLIASIAIVGLLSAFIYLRKRQLRKLRQRGIKRHGH